MGDKVTGMVGNEDLGQNIHHDGTPLHYNKQNADEKVNGMIKPFEKTIKFKP